jgi:transcriptional regulator with XRE-family HTH domain
MSEPSSNAWRVALAAPDLVPGSHPGLVIRRARQARAETQRQTGEACGFSQSEISRIESGKAHAYDIRLLARLARHLEIPPHLLGLAPASVDGLEEPVNRRDFVTGAAALLAGTALHTSFHGLLTGAEQNDDRFTTELLRSRWLDDSSPSGRDLPDLVTLRRAVARTKTSYQACRYNQTAIELPTLLAVLDAASSNMADKDRSEAEALAADAYHVAASLHLKLGNEGPAWVAADASMRAARRSDDPLALASSARILTHALMDARRYQDAETIARRMAEKLSACWTAPTGEALSVYGSLLLRGAIAAARAGDAQSAAELLREAEEAGQRLGQDRNLRWTAFGPTNVLLHQVNVAAALGNAGAALRYAKSVQLDKVPITERKASLLVDVASAYLQWGKPEQAYEVLCAAERLAPQELSGRPAVRQLILDTWTGAPATISRRVEELARRTGVAG